MLTAQKKQKLQELKQRLDALDQKSGGVLSAPDFSELEYQKRERPIRDAVERISQENNALRTNFEDISKAFENAENENVERSNTLVKAFEERISGILQEVTDAEANGRLLSDLEIFKVGERLTGLQAEYATDRASVSNANALLQSETQRLSQEIARITKIVGSPTEGPQRSLADTAESTRQARKVAEEAKSLIDELRRNVNSRLASLQQTLNRGGSANRNIAIGGNTSVLSRYTDINIKAGANVTLTYTNNNTTKYLDLTIAATGGGGGGSVQGITRSVNTVAVNTAAGAATFTDYVYLASGNITITLPTSVGNSNLYTVKNIGAGTVVVNTTGGETIDGGLTVSMPVQFTSVDLISNNSGNWDVT